LFRKKGRGEGKREKECPRKRKKKGEGVFLCTLLSVSRKRKGDIGKEKKEE